MSELITPGKKAGARLGGFVKNNGFVWLAFFASAGLMIFMWFCNQMIPFGGRTILRVDLYHQYGPLFAELFERLAGGRSLLYSWNTGLGGGFLGNFFNYLSSPTGLLVLLFGHKNVPEAIGVMVLLKCAFASGAFAYMLRKVHGKNDASIAAFGVLYSFCGFFIAYYWNVMWIDAMALLPLVMLGIYYIVQKQKFMLYSVTLAVTLVTSYYMGFMVCIFSVLFFLVSYFSQFEMASGLQPIEEGQKKKLKDNRLLRSGLTFAYASLIGGALAAFALLPVYFALKSSSATSGTFPKDISSNFQIFDFLVSHFADLEPVWRGSGPGVLPNVYSGVATMLLAPLFLVAPKIKAREKIAYMLLLIFMFFSFNTNVLNYIWHAMHFPNDLPYRFSFLYSFLLLWIAYKVFLNLKDIPLRAIVAVGGFAALFAVIAEKLGSKNIQDNSTPELTGATILITLAFIAAYTLIFAAIRRSPKAKAASLSMFMLCCVITEVCAADVKNFEITQEKVNFASDLGYFQQIKDDIYAQDDGFFRMELTDHRTRSDPAWFDYPGVSIFSSMAYERTANLESRLGLGSNFINSYTYNPNTPVYNAMHSLKYLVENQNYDSPYAGSSYLPVLNSSQFYARRDAFTKERFTVFENRYTLPVAFWADNDLRTWDTKAGSDPFRVQGDFWALAGAGEGVFAKAPLRLSEDFHGEGGMTAYVSGEYVSFSGKPAGKSADIPLSIEVEQARNVYIMADSNYATVHVNLPGGGVANRDHDEQTVWDIGVATPEEPLVVNIRLHKDDAPADGGFYVYTRALDMETFVRGYNKLKQGGLEITHHSDTLLAGTITAPADGLLYTSIPYDVGWQVSIDGKRVPVSSYVGLGDGGLLGVPLPKGTHRVTLRYVPQGLYYGMMISAAALILLAFTGLAGELLRRKKQQAGEEAPASELEPGLPAGLFSTANLNPEDFSLGEPWEVPPEPKPVSEPEPEPEPEQEPAAEPEAEPEAAPEPEPEEEETFELRFQEEEPMDAGSASINSILQEMQARAEELRRKMQVESSPKEDGGQEFKLVE